MGVFVKHKCPQQQQSPKLAIFSIKVMVTRLLTLVLYERVSLVEYAMPNMKSVSLTVQKLNMAKVKGLFCHRMTKSQTDRTKN